MIIRMYISSLYYSRVRAAGEIDETRISPLLILNTFYDL